MKTKIGLGIVCASMLVASAMGQTNTNDVALPPEATKFIQFAASATNLMTAVYGITSTDAKTFGGGVALAYRLSDMIVPTVRLDYYDRELWMPSADLQLQAPITLFGKFTMIPFAFAGVAEALGGSSSGVSSGSVVGMFGVGGAVRINSKWDVVGDFERWTGFSKDQVRFGVIYKW